MRPDAPIEETILPPPTEVVAGIYVVRLPLPARAAPVNVYLLRDEDGSITIFDTGIATGAPATFASALESIGARPHDVARIVVSHHHPDHIGGSGALHGMTGAPLLASRSTIQQAPDVWGDTGRMGSYFRSMREHVHEHGLPDRVAGMLEHGDDVAEMVVELPPDNAWVVLEEGEQLAAAGRTWRMLPTPGHADGHLVLLDARDGLMLAGDHLLERISPAVGRFPRHAPDPLASYLASLELVAREEVGIVLPGHGTPFEGARSRALELVAHHQRRIETCVAVVLRLGSATAYEAATLAFARVFDARPPDATNQRFATTETLAHLERARFEGRLDRDRGDDGLVRYRRAGS